MIRRRSVNRLGDLNQDPPSGASSRHQPRCLKPFARTYRIALLSLIFFGILALAFAFSTHKNVRSWLELLPSAHRYSAQSEVREGLNWVVDESNHSHRSAREIHHQWKVTSDSLRPDGVLKTVYLINGQFPGPTVQARSGDMIIVEVENGLENGEGISVHFHGLRMRGFNDMDGAVGISQDPIKPGDRFTYRFKIAEDQYGTIWYHAHDGVQRSDGMFGAFIVHRIVDGKSVHADREVYRYDEDRIIMIGDWYHRPATEVMASYMQAGSFGNEPVPDSLLVNGLGAYNCSKAVPARPVDCQRESTPQFAMRRSRRYRLRIINVGSLAGIRLTLPESELTVIEVDGGTDIRAETAHSVGVIYPGQRSDVILEFNSNTTQNELHVSLDKEGFRYTNPALTLNEVFPVNVSGQTQKASRTEGISSYFNIQDAKAPPLDFSLPNTSDTMLLLYTTTQKLSHLSNVPYGFMNQTSWKPQASPPGHLLNLNRSQWDSNQFVPSINLVSSDPNAELSAAAVRRKAWVTIILNNLDDSSHPFHIHGYSPYVLQTFASNFGWGSYNPYEMSGPRGGKLDLRTPVARDTFWVPKRGYVVLGFEADNPGIWMMHCHVMWHQSSGMAMALEIRDRRVTSQKSFRIRN